MKRFAASLSKVALGGALALLGGHWLQTARAAGPPADKPLVYSGVLEEGGQPVNGSRLVIANLWDAETNGTQLCSTPAAATVTVTGGRFSLALSDECVDTVRDDPDVWIEIVVDGTSLGRSKVGAVPYAIEAERAGAASGALQSTLDALAKPKLVNPTTQKEYGLTGTYCGMSTAKTGDLGGVAGAKTLCETTCGSPSAHMCTAREARVLAVTGTLVASQGWVDPETGYCCNNGAGCWTSALTGTSGYAWSASGTWLNACDASQPVHCCD